MDVESARAYLRKLPHVAETMQWGANLVYWVGDKSLGGKMFALLNLDAGQKAVCSFAAGPELYANLIEVEDVIPAPYLARAYWVALRNWRALNTRQLEEHFRNAHAIVHAKLPKKTRSLLA